MIPTLYPWRANLLLPLSPLFSLLWLFPLPGAQGFSPPSLSLPSACCRPSDSCLPFADGPGSSWGWQAPWTIVMARGPECTGDQKQSLPPCESELFLAISAALWGPWAPPQAGEVLGPNQVCKGPDLSSSLERGHAPLGVRLGGGVGGGELSDLSAARAQMECQHLQTAGDPGCFKREKGWATQAVGSPAVPESSQFLPQPSCSWEGGSVGGWLSLSLGGLNPALPVPGHEKGGLGGHSRLPGRQVSWDTAVGAANPGCGLSTPCWS